MNQILDHSGPKKKSNNNPTRNVGDIRKIIKVFAIIILAFGVVLIGDGAYAVLNSGKNKKTEEKITEPLITVTNIDDRLTIDVTHDKAIEKVTYQWDDSKITETKGVGKNEMRINGIGLLPDTHTFKVTAIDINGVESYFEEEYYSEDGVDTIPPVIDIITGNPVKIIATDETALSFITITVDGQEEKTIYASEGDNNKKIEYELDIVSDESEFTVSAVDTSNNPATRSNVKVLKKPKIELSAEDDYSTIYVKISSDLGLKRVQYTLNGKEYANDFDNPEEVTYCEFTITPDSGYNELVVKAFTTNDDVYDEQSGSCTYNP
ncbi:MAG: hypothetical protein IKG42_06125 [Clostridia bacterium]|nr:hypothetical protein [Clostridia bacterium]